MTSVMIIGSRQDPHVRAVADVLGTRPAVLDTSSLQQTSFEFSPPHIRIRTPEWTFEVESGGRGWLRRLSPMSWEAGTTIGSHDAVEKTSWLALLAALLRHPEVQWLSEVDTITAAENKLTQYTVAARLGISVPETLVSNDTAKLDALNGELIAKPLGPGHFQDDDGRWLTVFTEPFDAADPAHVQLLIGPPFIVQQRLRPTAHLRVVTVEDSAWVFRLSARGLPIDWREVEHAHRGWELARDDAVSDLALKLARAHGLGYSSQDWVESADDLTFLDLNPGGQWLFLPSPGADEVTASVADWLAEPCD